MGGAVSSGESNDDLIDNLLEADYIKSPLIERVFRAVDRAFYYTDPYKQNAYKDLAWKDGNLHLSAPCIYSEVLENLELKPGLSFLNIGSGTGYFSTMCGLILGRNGINHGIELYPDVVNYARTKLEEFLSASPAVDEFDLCCPEFTVGNCLDTIATSKRYDRIYCGATCPNDYIGNLIDMLKIGGICVVPVGDSLVQITRTEEKKDERKVLLPVTFATLISPKDNASRTPVELPDWSPKRLTELCRAEIRSSLRQTITYPEPVNLAEENRKKKRKRRLERRRANRLVVVQRRRSGDETEGENGFVAIAYSVGSNSSDEERNQGVSRRQNPGENAGTSSDESQTSANDQAEGPSNNELEEEGLDAVMQEDDKSQSETEAMPESVRNNDINSNGTLNGVPESSSGGTAVVMGSCPVYSTSNGRDVNGANGNRKERRTASATTSRGNSTRSATTPRSSRSARSYTTGAESLLGRIRELVRARQQDLESMRRQFRITHRDSDNSRSRSTSARENSTSDTRQGNENGHVDSLYSDITSSESSPSATSTSDDEVLGESQADGRKRCKNDTGDNDDPNKGDTGVETKIDPLLMSLWSVQLSQKILELPLPPALKVYLNYDRKLYH